MNITTKDLRTMWCSPLIWVLLALMSFIIAWLMWQMVDQYSAMQLSFQSLPNPPTLTDALWVPFVLMMAKILLVIIAYTAGWSIAAEYSQHTLWYLLINQPKCLTMVIAKFKAQLMILGFGISQMTVVAALLAAGGEVNWPQLLLGGLGLILITMWLIALGMLIASYCQNTGVAMLANLLVFGLLWMLGTEAAGQGYGHNWLVLFSPVIHLKWFCEGQINLASFIYLVGGAGVFLWLSSKRLERLKALL